MQWTIWKIYQKNLKYIKRYKFRHDPAVSRKHTFKIGDLVAYFVGDRSNRNTNQWWARYQIYKLLKFERNGMAATIQSIDDPKEQYTVANSMLVPYQDGSDWMNEMDYLKMVQARERDMKKVKKVYHLMKMKKILKVEKLMKDCKHLFIVLIFFVLLFC